MPLLEKYIELKILVLVLLEIAILFDFYVLNSKTSPNVFISNIVSDFVIRDCLSHDKKNVEHIKSELLNKLEGKFSLTKVFFAHEKRNDLRMKFFNSKIKPIFLPDLNNESILSNDQDNIYYQDNICKNDSILTLKNMISEISDYIMENFVIPMEIRQERDSDGN